MAFTQGEQRRDDGAIVHVAIRGELQDAAQVRRQRRFDPACGIHVQPLAGQAALGQRVEDSVEMGCHCFTRGDRQGWSGRISDSFSAFGFKVRCKFRPEPRAFKTEIKKLGVNARL